MRKLVGLLATWTSVESVGSLGILLAEAMSGPGPYIGSRISLISKAQIRYEGFLFAVDPTKSTVALSQGENVWVDTWLDIIDFSLIACFVKPVRSCGTEDRPAERVLGPRDEVYDYIVFRATDIQDLKVSEPPKESEPSKPPADPAIVSVCQHVTFRFDVASRSQTLRVCIKTIFVAKIRYSIGVNMRWFQ